MLQSQAVAALVQNIFSVQGIQHTTAHLGIEGHEGAIGVASHEQNLQGLSTLAADLVHQRVDSLLQLVSVGVCSLLHVEDLADVPHIFYDVVQRLVSGSTGQLGVDRNAQFLIGLDGANAAFGEHQRTLAKDQIRLRGKDGLLGNRLLIAKAVQRCNFISNVTLQGVVIIEHTDNFVLESQLDEQLSHGQLCGQHLFGGMIVGHIHSIAISVINLQGQGVGSLLSGRNGALGHR